MNITGGEYISIFNFYFCDEIITIICQTITFLHIIKPKPLFITLFSAVKLDLLIIKEKSSDTNLKINQTRCQHISSLTSMSPIFTYTITTSRFQNELVIFDINIRARNTVFEICETVWNRHFEGIKVHWPRVHFMFGSNFLRKFFDFCTLGPKLTWKTFLDAALLKSI